MNKTTCFFWKKNLHFHQQSASWLILPPRYVWLYRPSRGARMPIQWGIFCLPRMVLLEVTMTMPLITITMIMYVYIQYIYIPNCWYCCYYHDCYQDSSLSRRVRKILPCKCLPHLAFHLTHMSSSHAAELLLKLNSQLHCFSNVSDTSPSLPHLNLESNRVNVVITCNC